MARLMCMEHKVVFADANLATQTRNIARLHVSEYIYKKDNLDLQSLQVTCFGPKMKLYLHMRKLGLHTCTLVSGYLPAAFCSIRKLVQLC